MSAVPYVEFKWTSENPGNGESGAGLTQVFLELVKNLKQVKTICDLGCGNGYITGRLASLGYEVTGIDASNTGLALARKTYPQVEFIGDLIDEGLGNRTGLNNFDLVISSDVIEHLYRPANLLECAVSILKPGGQLLVGTPYHGYLKNLALSVTGKMDSHFTVLDDGGHIKFFSVRTLSQLITSHGFAELTYSFYGRAPWLWKNMICCARKNNA
jgi:2-polyprenyl-3-methyl-5-hydroxy-6-metoxy-1,4-benzoquinol methylase